MRPQDAEQIYIEITSHIKINGKVYSNWYCGLTPDWEKSLFVQHKVPRVGHPWIARQCYSSNDAEIVEGRLAQMGCEVSLRVADPTMTCVYAYLKDKETTIP